MSIPVMTTEGDGLSAEDVRISKMMAKALRHRPEAFGLTLDAHGWADASALIESIRARGFAFDRTRMDRIVAHNNKRRFACNADGTRIRASQGHTVDVDVEMPEAAPPVLLYHGTLEKSGASIWKRGLLPMKRQYVHLSPDIETARMVAERRKGSIAIYEVHAAEYHRDGGTFYLSENGVWQTKAVPPEYLKRIE